VVIGVSGCDVWKEEASCDEWDCFKNKE